MSERQSVEEAMGQACAFAVKIVSRHLVRCAIMRINPEPDYQQLRIWLEKAGFDLEPEKVRAPACHHTWEGTVCRRCGATCLHDFLMDDGIPYCTKCGVAEWATTRSV